MALLLTLCTLVLLHGCHVHGTVEDDFQVFVASKRLTPLLVFAPPAITTVHTIREPKLVSRTDVPLMLCGARILAPDLLVTSIRCCPSTAAMTDVYLFSNDATDHLQNLDTAKVIKDGVNDITFKQQHQLNAAGAIISNAALIKLNQTYFANHLTKSIKYP